MDSKLLTLQYAWETAKEGCLQPNEAEFLHHLTSVSTEPPLLLVNVTVETDITTIPG